MAGLTNDSVGLAYYGTADFSAKKGYLVTLGLSGGEMKATLATAGANPDGYVEAGYTTAKKSTINAMVEGNRVGCIAIATNAAIAIGDEVVTTAGGTIDKLPTSAGSYVVVGRAESAADAESGAEVIVRLKRRLVTVSE